MKKVLLTSLCVVMIAACKSPYAPPAYKHQTKKMDTPYTDWMSDQASAEKKAKKELDFYTKDECRRMSYGWHMKKIESPGELICEESEQGFHCRHTNVSVQCEQLDEK
ncbi:MAG: hypothetical protein ACU843_09740 [Gammaproteobacteria bacterium]